MASAPARGKIDPAWPTGRSLRSRSQRPRQGHLFLNVVLEVPRHRDLVNEIPWRGWRAGGNVPSGRRRWRAHGRYSRLVNRCADGDRRNAGRHVGLRAVRAIGAANSRRGSILSPAPSQAVHDVIDTTRWFQRDELITSFRRRLLLCDGHHHRPYARRRRTREIALQGADHDYNRVDGRTADHDELFAERPPCERGGSRRRLSSRRAWKRLGAVYARAGRSSDHPRNRG